MYKPVILLIMDGVGIAQENAGNALALAAKPNLEKISRSHPGTALHTSGVAAGLPWGEVGSSEVGHTNIGAGFIVYQNYPRISLAIQNKSFFKMPIWQEAMRHAKNNDSSIHLMGLLTGVGIHAHVDHINALLETFKKFKKRVFLHLFTDGEDSPPRSALKLLEKIENAQIAAVIGRNYAMDRNNRTELNKAAYDCLTKSAGEQATTAEEAIANSYKKNLGDEAIPPTVITDKKSQPLAAVKEKDVLIFFNFRSDRARQLAELFLSWKNLFFVTMTQYGDGWPARVAFPRQQIANPLSKILSDNQRTQLKVAESEKRAHITYFLNGGVEKPFPGEERIIVPSSGGDYTTNPEMSALQITETVVKQIDEKKYDFIAINFANGDMLGHTGNIPETVKSISVLDECIGKIYEKIKEVNGAMVITADHGNAEELINISSGEVDKEHSTNPVPFWIVIPGKENFQEGERTKEIQPGGVLADTTPTILELLGLPKPPEMEGSSLVGLNSRLIV